MLLKEAKPTYSPLNVDNQVQNRGMVEKDTVRRASSHTRGTDGNSSPEEPSYLPDMALSR